MTMVTTLVVSKLIVLGSSVLLAASLIGLAKFVAKAVSGEKKVKLAVKPAFSAAK